MILDRGGAFERSRSVDQANKDGSDADQCPDNWIKVPGNATYGTDDFCVMKYEAKAQDSDTGEIADDSLFDSSDNFTGDNADYTAVSAAEGRPWTNISQTESINKCQDIGGSLITNDERMTISRNIDQQADNWTGGSVGNGELIRGNHGNVIGQSLPVSDPDDPWSDMQGNTDPKYRRTHTLSNGEEILDMGGNARQWASDTIVGDRKPSTNKSGMPEEWLNFNSDSGENTDYGSLSADEVRASNNDWNHSDNGIGQYWRGSDSGGPYGFRFGGFWAGMNSSGVFLLFLDHDPSHEASITTFRCTRPLGE